MLLGTVDASSVDFRMAIRDLEAFLGAWPEAVRGIITARNAMTEFCRWTQKSRIQQVIVLGEGAG